MSAAWSLMCHRKSPIKAMMGLPGKSQQVTQLFLDLSSWRVGVLSKLNCGVV